jgi:hypothetical protein
MIFCLLYWIKFTIVEMLICVGKGYLEKWYREMDKLKNMRNYRGMGNLLLLKVLSGWLNNIQYKSGTDFRCTLGPLLTIFLCHSHFLAPMAQADLCIFHHRRRFALMQNGRSDWLMPIMGGYRSQGFNVSSKWGISLAQVIIGN